MSHVSPSIVRKPGGNSTSPVTLILVAAAAIVTIIMLFAGSVSTTAGDVLYGSSTKKSQNNNKKSKYVVIEDPHDAALHDLAKREKASSSVSSSSSSSTKNKKQKNKKSSSHHHAVADIHPGSPIDHPDLEKHHEGKQLSKKHADKLLRQALEGKNAAAKEIAPLLEDQMKRDAEYVASARASLECPPYDAEALDKLQIPMKHLPRKKKTSVSQKYNRRAHNCASHGIWNRVRIQDHHGILRNMARLGRIQRNSFVFDWGSGCGHSMDWLYKEMNVTGMGVDVSNLTIEYARENTTEKNMYCVADGTKLDWIPSNVFDHAISFGSIYHVYNRPLFCHILRQLVRIVRPVTGTVYNGWTENAEYKRAHVAMCLEDLPVHHEIFEEKKEFHDVEIYPLKAQQMTPNTYSLVIDKRSVVPSDEEKEKFSFEGVPIACDEHVCVKKKDEKGMEMLRKRALEKENKKQHKNKKKKSSSEE